MTAPLVPVNPRPDHAAGHELCPRCDHWVKVRAADRAMFVHRGAAGRCPGSENFNEIEHVVVTKTARYRVAGRYNAEVIANQLRRSGARPQILRAA